MPEHTELAWDTTQPDSLTRQQVMDAVRFIPVPGCEGCDCNEHLGDSSFECWLQREVYRDIMQVPAPYILGKARWYQDGKLGLGVVPACASLDDQQGRVILMHPVIWEEVRTRVGELD
jgi:hypothetical protein